MLFFVSGKKKAFSVVVTMKQKFFENEMFYFIHVTISKLLLLLVVIIIIITIEREKIRLKAIVVLFDCIRWVFVIVQC